MMSPMLLQTIHEQWLKFKDWISFVWICCFMELGLITGSKGVFSTWILILQQWKIVLDCVFKWIVLCGRQASKNNLLIS